MTSSTCLSPPPLSPPPLSPLTSDYTLGNDASTTTGVNDSAANKLPPEIIERILHHVTINSLPSCCLVNKLWLLCANPFLWMTISPQDVNDENFITQFANNYQHVRNLKVYVPCDTSVHQELLKPSPSESSAISATQPLGFLPREDDDDEDDEKPTITATKTLLDCRRLTELHLHYSASLINTLPHFRDTPHRPSVAPAIRLMIKSAEKIIENNVSSLRDFQVTGLCFPVGEPILRLIEKMSLLERLSFLKWVDYEGEEFFRMMVSASSTLQELSIELTDLTVSYSAIVLLYGWRHIYEEHQKELLTVKSSTTLEQPGTGSAATTSSTEPAEGSGTVANEGEDATYVDEEWIPGTRTTPSFAIMSAKTIAGVNPLNRLTSIKSLTLDRSTLNTQLMLRLAAVMPELTTLSLKQIYGIGNDDMFWDLETESILSEGMDMADGVFWHGPGYMAQPPFGQAGDLAGSGSEAEVVSGSDEEPDDMPDLIPAVGPHNTQHTAEDLEEGIEDVMPDHASVGGDSDDDLPDLQPGTSPLHVVNPDAGSPPAQSQQPSGAINSLYALDEDEMDYEDGDDDYEDDSLDDPYGDYSDDVAEYDDDFWGGGGGGGGAHYIHPMTSMGSILAQHVPEPMPHLSTQGATALSKAFRTLHPLCPMIDTFDFSGSRSEAMNETFFEVICELWGSGPNSDSVTESRSSSSTSDSQPVNTGLKVLNAADVCKVEAKFFLSISQRCSTTLTSLDLSLSPKMMWQLRSSTYEIEVRQGTYFDEILQILITCPVLEHLLVGSYPVNGRTIAAQDTNWVATRLRTLHLCIEFDEPSALVFRDIADEEVRQVRTKVCQQIGRLSRLESLTLGGGRPVSTDSAGDRVMDSANVFGGYIRGIARPGSNETPRKYIDLKLSSGLDHLAGLEVLETLDVVFLGPHGLRQDAELDWVLKHWPKLHMVTGFWDRAKLRASVRKYREDLKTPTNTPTTGPGAYFAKKRRERGVCLRPELELSIDPKFVRLNRRKIHVDVHLLDDLFMEEGMETLAVGQDSGIHKMYTPAARKVIEVKKAEKAKAKAAAAARVEFRTDDVDEDEPMDDDGDEEYTDVSDEDEAEEDDIDSESDDDDVPGVTRFNWHVRYIGGAAHAPGDASHGGIRNGELMAEVMRPREGGRSPSPLGTWY
ncbi:hypothetical protein BGZ96_008144 [Linnemannia gamsii]|uniref:F-box domain-containing protein n=1 Tax=Linnemannia gamsii TaxID=64522 RepID=A0ABQ7K001_9FUNG|nr:hypothetical protein BGZ96_008144 [Linnemannia gamsii]